MLERHYSKFLIVVIVVAAVASLVLLLNSKSTTGSGENKRVARAIEAEIAYQARVDFLDNLLRPARDLHESGKSQTALLELDKILQDYPSEGHALALKAEILFALDALSEAIEIMVRAVRKESGIVDESGVLSRRKLVESIVETGESEIIPRSIEYPDNSSLQSIVKKIYYLQSRLAGGCE